jgi:hypothetical protein
MKVLVVDDACETADGLAAVAKGRATLSPSPITRARRSTVRKGSLLTILFDVVSPTATASPYVNARGVKAPRRMRA